MLRFPLNTFFLDAVELIDDPFDIALGAVDLATGEVIGDQQLHRGFIGQNLFYALLRASSLGPRNRPSSSGGPRYSSGIRVANSSTGLTATWSSLSDGFMFPAPDLATGYRVGPGSQLIPYFRLQGMTPCPVPGDVTHGGAEKVLQASNANVFSFRYIIPCGDAREGQFEYVNHTQGGTFRMHTLFWKAFTRTRGRQPPGGPADTVSFAGFGTWCFGSVECPAFVAAQVSTSPRQALHQHPDRRRPRIEREHQARGRGEHAPMSRFVLRYSIGKM